MDKKQLTVREVIEQLQQLPPDALVALEGCDCYGPCCGVEFDDVDGTVDMRRG